MRPLARLAVLAGTRMRSGYGSSVLERRDAGVQHERETPTRWRPVSDEPG
jgi:hypothetical protein